MNRRSCRNVIGLERLVVGELLAGMNELDLIDLNAFLFLQRLLDGQNLIFGFKIESLLAARKCFDKDLEDETSDRVEMQSLVSSEGDETQAAWTV
jgi:hypothetical protein